MFLFVFFVLPRFGVILHEYLGFRTRLNNLVNADACDIERKRPDYIYIKYHIYKESMLQQKHEELQNSVCDQTILILLSFARW